MKNNGLYILILSLTIILSVSCTREAKKENTTINMSLDPKLSKVGQHGKVNVPDGYFPAHMIANLHYDGKTAFEEWDCKEFEDDGDPSKCAFPASINFGGKSFPRGSSRVVQILLVYANENENLVFAYDDAIGIEFNSSAVTVSIGSEWAEQGGGKMARVAGRHGSKMTGRVIGYYQPPRSGRPAMKLFRENIFRGWFNFMFLEGVDITYKKVSVLSSGTEEALFIETSLDDILSELGANKAGVAVTIPSFYEVYEQEENIYESHLRESQNVVLAFFDSSGHVESNGVGKSIALPSADDSIGGTYRKESGANIIDPVSGGVFVDPDNPTSVGTESMWTSHELTFITGVDPANTSDFQQTHGLSTSNSTACASIDDDNLVTPSCMELVPSFVKNGELVPFEGPFESMDTGYGSETLVNITGTDVNWQFLPGVAGVAVQGLALFVVDRDLHFRDYVPCHEMAMDEKISNVLSLSYETSEVPVVYHRAIRSISSSDTVGYYDFSSQGLDFDDLENRNVLACPWVEVDGKKVFYSVAAESHGFYGSSSYDEYYSLHIGDNDPYGWDNIADEEIVDIHVLDNGDVIMLGNTTGSLIEPTGGNQDIFIAKFDRQGGLLWAKQFGDTTMGAAADGIDEATALAVDSAGDIYIAGFTNGNFGTSNLGNYDPIVIKLTPSGNFYGGFDSDGILQVGDADTEQARAIVIHSGNKPCIAGITQGDWPTGSWVDGNKGFIYCMNDDGSVDWLEDFRTSGEVHIDALAVDSGSNIIAAGETSASLYESSAGGYDVFAVKRTSTGSVLWDSQMGNTNIGSGASSNELVTSVAIDSNDHVYIAGTTAGSFSGTFAGGGTDIFIVKVDSSTGNFLDSTQINNNVALFDASGGDSVSDIVIDNSNNVFITGYTTSNLFDTNGGFYDVFVAKFQSDLTLSWGMQEGATSYATTSDDDYGIAIALDYQGNLIVGGQTDGDLFDTSTLNDAILLIFDSDGYLYDFY